MISPTHQNTGPQVNPRDNFVCCCCYCCCVVSHTMEENEIIKLTKSLIESIAEKNHKEYRYVDDGHAVRPLRGDLRSQKLGML